MECSTTNWFVQVDERLQHMVDTEAETEQLKKRSIYKAPACVTDLNKKAYQPQAVSFGPYHHGEESMKQMEEHKQRALLHFLKRSNKHLQVLVDALAEVVEDLKAAYDPLDASWKEDTARFLQLMILDGCFMLELMRVFTYTLNDYATNDPIFSSHGKLYMMPYIRRDMLMLENQLPMLVLEKLLAVETDKPKDEDLLNRLIHKFCFPEAPVPPLGKCLHVLDLYRKSLLQEPPTKKHGHSPGHHKHRHKAGDDTIRSAMELDEAGIRFKTSKTRSLKDISFKRGVLRLPVIVVDDATESMFLNLMAFERFHVGAGNEVTSYIFFMDNIIDNARDVALLHSRGIIQSAIGSDKAVAKLFNSLSKDTTLDPYSKLDVVHKNVNAYCKKKWNEWRANLIHTYFRNPWAFLSLIAAIFLFALTIAQTVYSTLAFYQNETPPASPRMDPPPPSPPLPPPPPPPASPPMVYPPPPCPPLPPPPPPHSRNSSSPRH